MCLYRCKKSCIIKTANEAKRIESRLLMNKYLIVVDMQNDFIDGSLGTKEAEKIVGPVIAKIESFDGTILYTQDTHKEDYLSSQEGKNLPVRHCIEGTKGWELNEKVAQLCHSKPIMKPTFGSDELALRLQKEHANHPIDSITLIGLCTDICVISNAFVLKAFLPEVPIIVDAACCAGVTVESHRRALESMKTCQITIENEENE